LISAQFAHELLGGRRRSPGTRLLRCVLACAEPPYAAAMAARNLLYDCGVIREIRVDVPVISVGNITTGGTGKTPFVRWLILRLCNLGFRPAVLLRGYGRSAGGISDEQAMLRDVLGKDVPVHAEADRVAGARAILRQHPQLNLLVLDDGFQHRRIARDFDLVLVDACNPFGFDHVLPRGLLREPLGGLRRASAFLITRSDQVDEKRRLQIEATLRGHNHVAPIYTACHVHLGLRSAGSTLRAAPEMALDLLKSTPYLVVSGIAQPEALERQLRRPGDGYRGHCRFPDHHDYTADDLLKVRQSARAAGANAILVTEKDWVKLRTIPAAFDDDPPIWRIDMEIAIPPSAEKGLLDLIQARIEHGQSARCA